MEDFYTTALFIGLVAFVAYGMIGSALTRKSR